MVALIVGGVDVVRNGLEAKASHDAAEQAAKEAAKAKCDAYSWPTTDLASQLPKPESSKGKIEKDSSSAFYIKVCGTDATAYDNYVKALQEKGFTVDYFKSSSAFNAKNAAGYSVNIRRFQGRLHHGHSHPRPGRLFDFQHVRERRHAKQR